MKHDVTVRKYEPSDLQSVYGLIAGWPNWWKSATRPKTYDEFRTWWEEKDRACLVGIDKGEVIGFAYLDPIYKDVWATPHIVKRKGYGNPRLVLELSKGKFQGWFEQYGFQKLWTWTATVSAVRLALLLGFRVEGKVRRYIKTDSGWLDAWQLSLLREEAWKITPIRNVLRLLWWECLR